MKWLLEFFIESKDKRHMSKIRISKGAMIPDMFKHISRYQLEKKFGGYIDNLEKDYWPSKAPNRCYWLPGESEADKYITPVEYYEKYKAGHFDRNLDSLCQNLIKPFEEKRILGKKMSKTEKEEFYETIGFDYKKTKTKDIRLSQSQPK